MKVHLPDYAERFAPPYTVRNRFKCLYGGRGSSKTWTVATLLILDALTRPIRVACGREHKTSIRQSAKMALDIQIRRLGLDGYFNSQAERIVGKNGSEFFFEGVAVNPDNLRGWEDVDHVWIEEAQFLSDHAANVLIPTIRKPGSQLWFTWNPANRHDWVWRRFVLNPQPYDVTEKVNYNNNPWFPYEAEQERRAFQKYSPDLYAHIWEGEPDDEGQERKVLPYALAMECVDAWRKRPELVSDIRDSGMMGIDCGLDVADTGDAFNALVKRKGGLLLHAEKWRTKYIGETARRADVFAKDNAVTRIYYDVGGVGAGVRSYFHDFADRPYSVRPENFGGSIHGGETTYSYRVQNKDFFARRNAQLGWTLRIRATNTRAMMAGEADIDPYRCLFINPDIYRLDEFMAQLSQPSWEENPTGKVAIVKRDEEEASPDLYDAAVLAFARDSLYGLRYK